MVLWTQKSGAWLKFSGIAGDPLSWMTHDQGTLKFLGTLPDDGGVYVAVDFNPISGELVWNDRDPTTASSRAIYRQPLNETLGWSDDGRQTVAPDVSATWTINGLSVDWFTGNVYVAESRRRAVFMTRYDATIGDLYRVVFSDVSRTPTGICNDPYIGQVSSSQM